MVNRYKIPRRGHSRPNERRFIRDYYQQGHAGVPPAAVRTIAAGGSDTATTTSKSSSVPLGLALAAVGVALMVK